MKRVLICVLASVLVTAAAAGCVQGEESGSSLTPQARTQLYRDAISSARDQETNDAYAIVTSPEDPMAEVILAMLGLEPSDMAAYALSVSPMNTRAYGVAAIYPAAGRADAVLEGLNRFIDQQKRNFEQYLVDQYEIAASARLETLEDGTVLLVMCQQPDGVFDTLRDTILAG